MKLVIVFSIVILVGLNADSRPKITPASLSDNDSTKSESAITVKSLSTDVHVPTEVGSETTFDSLATEESAGIGSQNNIESSKENNNNESHDNSTKSSLCYETILCDSKKSKRISLNPETDIKFLLLKDGNQITLKTQAKRKFSGLQPTKIIIHGFLQNSTEPYINKVLSEAYKKYRNINVITVNWGESFDGKACYETVKELVPEIGSAIAKYLDFLMEPDPFAWHKVTVIGHSIGAHIAAFVSRNVQNGKVASIIGLDPAAPLFAESHDISQLNKDDAEHVEVIHTNGKCYGIQEAIGDADFYVNGGDEQPACKDDDCNHERAIDLFAESVGNTNRLCATRCDSKTVLRVRMGGEPGNNHRNVGGSYCISTSDHSPFGIGKGCEIKKRRKKKRIELWERIKNFFSSIFG